MAPTAARTPLRTPLLNGQTVEVITATGAHPNPAWLNFVTTAKARSNIRHYLKNLQNDEATELGQRMLDKALHNINSALAEVSEKQFEQVTAELSLDGQEDQRPADHHCGHVQFTRTWYLALAARIFETLRCCAFGALL